MNLETRTQSNTTTAPTNSGKVGGYAAVYDSPSQPLPGGRQGRFVERIAPGAFDASLDSGRNVRLFFGHEERGLPLASTEAGTMRLSTDANGLRFDAELADTTQGRDIRALLERGDIGGRGSVSFGFTVVDDEWNAARTTRVLNSVDLYEVSIVSDAAYPATASTLRSWPGVNARRLQLANARLGNV